jgi:hypothetical protein
MHAHHDLLDHVHLAGVMPSFELCDARKSTLTHVIYEQALQLLEESCSTSTSAPPSFHSSGTVSASRQCSR